ncbi:uncharacterized protein V1510DRAFT_420771 [Dipodascopsis tothii]|uniref:uncharacterized protein n=1 Tax=Dipodascopsis tothii TaxID=44089 RepID=UPI0034CF99C9
MLLTRPSLPTGLWTAGRVCARRWNSAPAVSAELRTIVRPASATVLTDIVAQTPASGGVVVLATPQYANELYAAVAAAGGRGGVFGAVVDTIPTGGVRDGVSYLRTSAPITLNEKKSMLLRAPPATHSHADKQGRYVTSGGQQWELSKAFLSLHFGDTGKVTLQAANTLFQTGVESVLVGPGPAGDDLYAHLALDVPVTVALDTAADSAAAFLEPLTTGESLRVTSSKANMLRTINGKPASSFLEASLAASLFLEAPPMKTALSSTPAKAAAKKDELKARSVYAVLDGGRRVRVIAGGGGWGARAGMLVLDPELKSIPANSSIAFMISSDAKAAPLAHTDAPRVVFECVEPEQTLAAADGAEAVVDGVFGAGTENHMLVNGRKLDVYGERCVGAVAA